MDTTKVLEYLEDLAETLGVEIIHEKLNIEDFPVKGGLCRIKGMYKVFIDKSETTEGQVKILAKALSSFDTERVYLLPQIRGILEKAQRSF
jgi:hypothetical protein